jgi:hypothetical protein
MFVGLTLNIEDERENATRFKITDLIVDVENCREIFVVL